jgi:hypothetical protein
MEEGKKVGVAIRVRVGFELCRVMCIKLYIEVNHNLTHLVKHVKPFNHNLIILYWVRIEFIRGSCKKFRAIMSHFGFGSFQMMGIRLYRSIITQPI